MHPAQFFCWHFMTYPYLPKDFDEKYDSAWVTVPNTLWDRERTRGLYQEYLDQLVYGEELGFDGLVLNEHHQNAYGLMPSPNLLMAALTQRTRRAKLVVLVSHDLLALGQLCDRVIWMEQGRIRQDGPAAEVIAAYQKAARPPQRSLAA